MIGTYKPLKVGLFDNRKTKYTAAQVKSKTGADIVFNGGFFDSDPQSKTYLQPYCPLIINGNVAVKDKDRYFGYAWNSEEMPTVEVSTETKKQNFISCLWAISNGEPQKLLYKPDVAGVRGRTAFGFRADGQIVVLCTSDAIEPMTPEKARDKLLSEQCVSGIVLDGGGSCQCITPTETVKSSRIVSNFVCVWLDKIDKTPPIVNDNKGSDTLNIIQPNYKWAYAATLRTETKYFVLHHVGAKGSFTPEQIHAEHLRKGWRGIAYNFYIRKDGTIYHGREENAAGGHAKGYNTVSIGICFEGNFETETMSDVQLKAGIALLAYLRPKYPSAKTVRHKDLNATACPGKNFPFDKMTAIAPTTVPTAKTIYRVIIPQTQLGAFTDKAKAESLLKDYTIKGLKPYITEEKA